MPVVATGLITFLSALSSMMEGAQNNNAGVQQSFYNFQSASDINAVPLETIRFPQSGFPQTNSEFPLRNNTGRGGPLELFYVQGETIARLIADGDGNVLQCELVEVNKPVEQELAWDTLRKNNKLIETPDFNTMIYITRACQALDGDAEFRQQTDPIQTFIQTKLSARSITRGIMPGTKWCGVGDRANGWNDLGPLREIDKCCRSHDLCPRKVLGFSQAYGLMNSDFYTKSHCECDAMMHDCLKHASAQNPAADLVGNFFFNILRVQCIEEENPPECLEGNGITCSKWVDGDTDTRANQRLVTRDPKQYTMSIPNL